MAALGAGLAVTARLPGWPLWGAALWVAQEAARDRGPFGGFPWGRLAFAQAESPLAWLSAYGGAPLVTFAVALAGSLLAALALALAGHAPRRTRGTDAARTARRRRTLATSRPTRVTPRPGPAAPAHDGGGCGRRCRRWPGWSRWRR